MAKATAKPKTAQKTAPRKVAKKTTDKHLETNLIRRVTEAKKNMQIPAFRAGDTVNVSVKVKEGDKERLQSYKGIVIKVQGAGPGRSFTVRKMSAGVGVERTFPFASPVVDKVEILTRGQVRRGKLYFLRALEGKAAKINSEIATAQDQIV